jgi:ubiquinone/menaquinone biosynthesis C-methylase UbiE
MSQKDIFLQSEGDAWYIRNQQALATRKLPDADPLLCEILDIHNLCVGGGLRVLEIGCGDGTRLAWLKDNLNADCYGIEPSAQAVAVACAKGLNVQQGTADVLPFDDQSFDIVIFGFCLYLCDREDLFRIASAADRVLRAPGWLMILDFFSPMPRAKTYHHSPGVQSYKMDYRTLFNWHPDYACMTHKLRHHSELGYTDEQDEWMAVSILRKHHKDLNA